MAGRKSKSSDVSDASLTRLGGKPYRQIVARHIVQTFAGQDLCVYEEVSLGSSIIGKDRRVDILVVSGKTGRAIAIQAKYQRSGGTTDEKIHYALADCAAMWIPAVVAYGGGGWSPGVRHTLEASRHAAKCEVDEAGRVSDAKELVAFVAAAFDLWPLVLRNKTPVEGKAVSR